MRNLDNALDWIEQVRRRRGVLTNMHIDLDYDDVAAETPAMSPPPMTA